MLTSVLLQDLVGSNFLNFDETPIVANRASPISVIVVLNIAVMLSRFMWVLELPFSVYEVIIEDIKTYRLQHDFLRLVNLYFWEDIDSFYEID